jgi:FKBP-type peptidyl-prolyl cis-trans isomerase
MKIIRGIFTIAVVATMFSCGNQFKEVKSLETEIDSASYALGLDMAIKVKANFKEADRDLFLQGYKNGIDSTNLLINTKDLNAFLRVFFQKQQAAKQKEQQEKSAKIAEAKFGDNKKAGEDFLAENKSKKGVIVTESGLQYSILKEGKGAKPVTTSKVKVHYHGTNIDGAVFDSSVDRGTPAEFGVTQVIKGWTEGLQLMKKGAKYKFFIPQELAYGQQQRGKEIKPFSMLIFEVELLDVLDK